MSIYKVKVKFKLEYEFRCRSIIFLKREVYAIWQKIEPKKQLGIHLLLRSTSSLQNVWKSTQKNSSRGCSPTDNLYVKFKCLCL